MKDDPLPDNDNVVRYVRPGLRDGEQVDGNAFLAKDGETTCSINWIDYFKNQSKEQQLREVRQRIRLELRTSGRFAELNVGRTRQHLADEIKTLKFVEDPLMADMVNNDDDPSHALIKDLPDPVQKSAFSEMIGDMIAECIISPLHEVPSS